MNKDNSVGKSLKGALFFIIEYLSIRAITSNIIYRVYRIVFEEYRDMSTQELMSITAIPNLLIGNLLVIFVFIIFHYRPKIGKLSDIFIGYNLGDMFKYITLGLTINVGVSVILTLILSGKNIALNNETTEIALTTLEIPLWFNILATGVVSPLSEELIYREGILSSLRSGMSDNLAIFVSALLFGIMHMSLVQGLYAFVLGLVFSIVVCKRNGNPLPSILMHISINVSSLILSHTGMSNIFVMVWLVCTFWLIARLFTYIERRRSN